MTNQTDFKRYNDHRFFFKDGAPDYTIFDKKLEVLKSIAMVANSSVYIRDLYKKSYPFFSNVSIHLTGYTQEELYELGDEIFIQLLSKEDLNFMMEVEKKLFDLIYSFDKERLPYYVVTISNNFLHKDGYFVPVNIYITPFLFDDDNHIWMNLVRIGFARKSPKNEHFLYLDMLDSKERYIYNKTDGKFDLQKIPTLTQMEKSVLVLSIKGYLEKEIADILDISVNTVKTHKRNFLKKLDADNVSEALIMCSIHKMI